MRIDEAVKIAKLLEETSISAIEVSCGIAADGFNTIRVTSIPNDAVLEFTDYKKLSAPVKFIFPAFTPFVVKLYEPLHNYNVGAASQISANVNIPVIVVGGIRNMDDISSILSSGAAQYVSMGRPFIIEPDIVNRFMKEQHAKSACIDCGFCIVAANSTDVRCFYGKV